MSNELTNLSEEELDKISASVVGGAMGQYEKGNYNPETCTEVYEQAIRWTKQLKICVELYGLMMAGAINIWVNEDGNLLFSPNLPQQKDVFDEELIDVDVEN